MISRNDILRDLLLIKHYYSRKKDLFQTDLVVSFLPIVSKYDTAISNCPNIKLVDLYKCVYQDNYTLSSVAVEWGICRRKVTELHNELLRYFSEVLNV